MTNPWKLKPLLICATPIVAALLQVILLGLLTEWDSNGWQTMINGAITLVLFLPLVSLPTLSAAVGGWKTKVTRGWYGAGVVLNAGYCLFLWVPVVSIFMMLTHGGRK